MLGGTGLNLRDVKTEVEELLDAYVQCLDDGRYEEWPGFFVEDAPVYRIISRENHDRGLQLATMSCESRGMMEDRVVAIRNAVVYSPQYLRHLVGAVRVTGREGDAYTVQSNYAVFNTVRNEETRVFNTGRYLDEVVFVGGAPKFRRKVVVYDTVQIPSMLVIPL
jgi:anthranilate 1,2-dioxygenase small subunit